MKNDSILLSICIPTYNGGEKLSITLSALFQALKDASDIEVIVSDNCSTDNTSTIISNFLKNPQLKTYRNKENLGFNRNMFLLIQQYAQGKYCWVIGDDDFIDSDSICHIRKCLENGELEYLSLSHRVQTLSEYQSFQIAKRRIVCIKSSFVEAIEHNATNSNILGTFMSSSIFIKEKINTFDFSIFSNNTWDNYYSTFPNAFLMMNLFAKSQCGYIPTPLLTALAHEKDWDDKSNLMIFHYLPLLYQYCKKKTGENLPHNKTIIWQSICGRILTLTKQGNVKQIPSSLLVKSLFESTIYKLIYKKIK